MTWIRPAHVALLLLAALLVAVTAVHLGVERQRRVQGRGFTDLQPLVSLLGLADLAVSTEARYTRHPAVTDRMVIFMDYPGAIDHFPSTLFFAAPR
jgi:hypothetical protein